jgi:fervidolysin-like protein
MMREPPRHVEGQLVIKLRKEFATNQEARCRIIESLPEGITVVRDFDELGLAVIDLPQGDDLSVIARVIENDRAVQYVEPNFIDSGNKP